MFVALLLILIESTSGYISLYIIRFDKISISRP